MTAFVVGFAVQDVFTTLYIFLAGVVLTFVVCFSASLNLHDLASAMLTSYQAIVPAWPWFKTRTDVWLENESKKAYAEAVRKLQEELDGESARG